MNEDARFAKETCAHDNVVDGYRTRILGQLIDLIRKDPVPISSYLHIERISKSLERIADLCTNIGEDVVYIVEGEIIKT